MTTEDERELALERIARMRDDLADRSKRIAERDLDRAGVPQWRERLEVARAAGPPFDAYAIEWRKVRLEYLAAGGA